MVDLNHKLNWQQFLVLAIVIGAAIATPMYYKKKDGDTYEPGKLNKRELMELIIV